MDSDTLDDDDLPPLTAEWLAEAERRSAEFDADSVNAIPWKQIRSDAFRRAGLELVDELSASYHNRQSTHDPALDP
ncbi:MAG TPA: addiction module protein [Pirellulales bacterium]